MQCDHTKEDSFWENGEVRSHTKEVHGRNSETVLVACNFFILKALLQRFTTALYYSDAEGLFTM